MATYGTGANGHLWYMHLWPLMAQALMATYGTGSTYGHLWHRRLWPLMAQAPLMATYGTGAAAPLPKYSTSLDSPYVWGQGRSAGAQLWNHATSVQTGSRKHERYRLRGESTPCINLGAHATKAQGASTLYTLCWRCQSDASA